LKTTYLAAFIALAIQLPCGANNPAADFLSQELAAGLPIAGVGGTFGQTGFHIDGAPGCTAAQFAQMQTDAQNFDWTIHAAPNPLGAEKAIRSNGNISTAAKIELAKLKSVLDAYPQDPAGVKQMWGAIKATDAQISAVEATEVENVCAQFNMPLK
jgi:hypothetical protein